MQDTTSGVFGTVYLIHFDRPYRHAGHYTGWAANLDGRFWHHQHGSGARLTQVAVQAGIILEIVRTMPGTREDERRIKKAGGQRRYCPACVPNPRSGVWGFQNPSTLQH
jgi:predicted GIY-YIG superfamily endonuclease